MKTSAKFAFTLFAVLSTLIEAHAITDLTEATFDTFIKKHDVVMVEFYAPWCDVCRDLQPVYEETAAMHITDKDIRFARVDCVADQSLCQNWRVPIYPTIRVFKGLNEQELYNGPRTPAEMIEAVEWFLIPTNETVLAGDVQEQITNLELGSVNGATAVAKDEL